MAAENPFMQLITSEGARKRLRQLYDEETGIKGELDVSVPEDSTASAAQARSLAKEQVSRLFESTFLLTARDSLPNTDTSKYPSHVFKVTNLAAQMAAMGESPLLSESNIDQALVERLQPTTKKVVLTNRGGLRGTLFKESDATEAANLSYLACCYERAERFSSTSSSPQLTAVSESSKKLAAAYASSQLSSAVAVSRLTKTEPKLAQKQTRELTLAIFQGNSPVSDGFLNALVERMAGQDLKELFRPTLDGLLSHLPQQNTFPNQSVYPILQGLHFFARNASLAELLTSYSTWLPSFNSGQTFENSTLLGQLLCLSSLSSRPLTPPTMFADLEGQTTDSLMTKVNVCRSETEKMVNQIAGILKALLRHGGKSRDSVLQWMVQCLKTNASRGQMAAQLNEPLARAIFVATTASDAFFLNLLWVMLKVAEPFTKGGLIQAGKVDPTYTTVIDAEQQPQAWEQYGGPVLQLSSESKLVPLEEGVELPSPSLPFSFVTHWFHLTQRCLALAFPVTVRSFTEIRGPVEDALEKGALDHLQLRMQDERTSQLRFAIARYYLLKAQVSHPHLLEAVMQFEGFVCDWLLYQVIRQQGHPDDGGAVTKGSDEAYAYSSLGRSTAEFLQQEVAPPHVRCVTESAVELVAETLAMCTDLDESVVTELGSVLFKLGLFASIYVGWKQLVCNPHLRARLVEVLAYVLDASGREKQDVDLQQGLLLPSQLGDKERRFEDHVLVQNILVENVVRIFIDTEESGEDMLFEQKYRYRHLIYNVLCNVWQRPAYQHSVRALSEAAQAVYSSLPIFLRFLHLLFNDAMALLDRSLEALKKVKVLEEEADNEEEWANLSEDQRKEKEAVLKDATDNANQSNQMAARSVQMVVMVTETTSKAVVIDTMVDRVVAMLNYFLSKLIGPERNAIKVADFAKVSFDARALLENIVQIYLNLAAHDSFCRAVCEDRRFYSPELFEQALQTLRALQMPLQMVLEFRQFTEQLLSHAKDYQAEQELADKAPSEFCDALMGSLMNEPVELPSSKAVMDRVVILRHLMSDPRDPFTRQSLTPDMLVPKKELQGEIEEWRLKQECQEAEEMHNGIAQHVEEKGEEEDMVEDLGDDEDLY